MSLQGDKYSVEELEAALAKKPKEQDEDLDNPRFNSDDILASCRKMPYEHQRVGVRALLKKPIFALFDEMGAGKTKQVIDAAQILFRRGEINQVLVVAPAAVRSVWYDEEFGELAKHLWHGVPNRAVLYHWRTKYWNWHMESSNEPYLRWVITNYEFVRSGEKRLLGILDFCTKNTLLVVEESSAIKSYSAKQTKAVLKIRAHCGRVVLLNGTPIANSPGDMYSQGMMMDPKILDCPTANHFRSRYAVIGGWQKKQVTGWIGIKDLQQRFAPYVLRRLKKDCLDLPAKLDPITISIPLSEETWVIYRKMKEQFIAWLDDMTIATASQAIVRILRMAQLCGGFLGGLEERKVRETEQPPAWMIKDILDETNFMSGDLFSPFQPIREVGREKHDYIINWSKERLSEDKDFKLLVWCRFTKELERLADGYSEINNIQVGKIYGNQSKEERDYALQLLNPDSAPEGPAFVVGSPQAGGMGLNLAGAHTAVYYSNGYNMKDRLQSMDRLHRPGQKNIVSYFDLVATGPNGERTIDHTILRAQRNKENLATMTTEAWLEALKE